MSFSVTLPLPPSANRLFANVPGKGRVKTRAYKLWRKNAVLSIFAQARADRRLSGAVSIDIVLPEMCRLDIDNAIKPILDALVASQRIDDDRYVAELHVRRVRSDETVLVSVERMARAA